MTDCNDMAELPRDSAGRKSHLESCASCRLEEKWRADFAEPSSEAGDSELEQRLVARVLERPSVRVIAPRPRRTRYVVMALAATLLVGLAFAASLGRSPAPGPRPANVDEAPAPPTPVVTRAVAPPVPVPEPIVEQKKAAPSPSTSANPSVNAEELFTRANSARRAGNVEQALGLYRELQRAKPRSREALASRALVGRLLLDRGDARGALPEFDAYLASGGTLSEEALAGRALCLERLGRTSEEQAAWRTLLERHPTTLHRAHAEERLGE